MKYLLLIFPLLACLTAPARASSLPQADFQGLHFGLGSGPSASLEVALSPQLGLGGAIASPLLFGGLGVARYEGHLSYRLLSSQAVDVAVIAGAFGDLNLSQRADLSLSPFGLELGLGIAWHVSKLLSVRVNIVPALPFSQAASLGLFPPAGGVEVGYHPIPALEVTVGFNGNGDLFGFNYRF